MQIIVIIDSEMPDRLLRAKVDYFLLSSAHYKSSCIGYLCTS